MSLFLERDCPDIKVWSGHDGKGALRRAALRRASGAEAVVLPMVLPIPQERRERRVRLKLLAQQWLLLHARCLPGRAMPPTPAFGSAQALTPAGGVVEHSERLI